MSISDTKAAQKYASIAEVAAAQAKEVLTEALLAPEYADQAAASAADAAGSAQQAQDAANNAASNATSIINDQLAEQKAEFDADQAERKNEYDSTLANLIPLSRQYMTLADAQADIANIPAGSVTYVRSADGSTLADEYENIAGTLTATGRSMPSEKMVEDVNAAANQAAASAGIFANDIDDGYQFAIADKNGKILELIDDDFVRNFLIPVIIQGMSLKTENGSSGLYNTEGLLVGFDEAGNVTTGGQQISENTSAMYSIIDSTGKVLLKLSNSAQLIQNGTEQSLSSGISDDLYSLLTASGQCLSRYDKQGKFRTVLHDDVITQIADALDNGVTTPLIPRVMADRVHIQMHGQSLAVGIGSTRISSSGTVPGVFMPSGGIEDGQTSTQGIEGLPLTSTSLVAMNPQVSKNTYESPLYGVCAQLQGMLDADVGAVYVTGSSSAHGEYKISQLNKGTPQYNVAIAQNAAYGTYSSTDAKSFMAQVLCWLQGESDITAGTPPADYLSMLNQLIEDYKTDVGQGVPPVMVTYQTGSHTKRSPYYSPDIPEVQLLAANTNPYIFMACATYVFPYNSDGVHMPANSYRWMGCYFGKAIYNIMTKNEWKPLQPEEIYRNGRVVTVVMHVPVSPMVLDTDMVSNPGDYGFEVWGGADGLKKTIQSVSLSGDRVTIVLDADPSQRVVVKYAQGTQGSNAGPTTGARGNLRDSDATLAYCRDVSSSDPNATYKLYNWCPIFSLSEGFSWEQ